MPSPTARSTPGTASATVSASASARVTALGVARYCAARRRSVMSRRKRVKAVPAARARRRDRQLDGELAPIAVQRLELRPRAKHRPLAGLQVALQSLPMRLAVALGGNRVSQ